MIRTLGIIFLWALSGIAAFGVVDNPDSGLVDSVSGMLDSDAAKVANARRALDSGMPALAQIILERLTVSSHELQKEAALVLVDALISEGRYEDARKKLAEFDSDKSPNINIRRAVISVSAGDGKGREILSGINAADLDGNLLPWYYISLGLINFDEGVFGEALVNFEKAKATSKAPAIQTEADILANLCKISQDLKAESLSVLADELAVKSAVFMGMPAGAQYAKQHAIVLDRLGRKKEAIEAVENQLQTPLMTDADRDELRLIGAYIDTSLERRRSILIEILKTTRSPEITEQAVHMLRYAYDFDSPVYESVLLASLEAASDLVKDRLLLELAYLALRKNEYPVVELYANRLLSDYPASIYALDAHRLLAFGAFSSDSTKKADYRLAASQLLKVAALEKNPQASSIAKFIAADCYFLEQDYETAAAMYEAAIGSELPVKWKSAALGRAIESLIALGRLDAAVALLEGSRSSSGIVADDIWRAEWALATAYRDRNESDKSAARIDRLLAGPVSESADGGLRARLLWLQARMSENSGDYATALAQSDALISLVKSGRLKITDGLANVIISNTMLMRARLLAAQGNFDGEEGAFAAYEALQKAYHDSDAAQLSYLYEASNSARRGLFGQAQQHCKTLADNFPNGKYADIALIYAALYSEKLGLQSDLRDALELLDRLVKNYPNSPKVFDAKMAYAKVLRLMNDYANAAALYKNIAEDYPKHPRKLAAEISIGDCLMAINGQDSAAAAVFERLYSAPSTPREAAPEIAFKWGFVLGRAGRKAEASRIWWICASELLEKGKASELGANERYWIARSLIMLARSLEQSGEKRSAISAYELLIKYDLPESYAARQKLLEYKEK